MILSKQQTGHIQTSGLRMFYLLNASMMATFHHPTPCKHQQQW